MRWLPSCWAGRMIRADERCEFERTHSCKAKAGAERSHPTLPMPESHAVQSDSSFARYNLNGLLIQATGSRTARLPADALIKSHGICTVPIDS